MREQTVSKKTWALLALIVAVALCALAFVGCGGNSSQSATESQTGKDEAAGSITPTAELDGSVLKMGVDAEGYAPSVWEENGAYTGYDYDLASEAAHRLGWELQVVPVQWDQMSHDVDDGVVDCIWNGVTMNIGDRASQFGFSQPYMKSDIVVVVRLDNESIKTIDDLKGKRIAVQDGSTAAEVLEDNLVGLGALSTTDGTLQLTNSLGLAFQRLGSGAVDAVVCDDYSADYYVHGGDKITITDNTTQASATETAANYRVVTDANDQPIVLYRSLDAVAVARGNVALADDITNALYQMYEDGAVKAILEKYADYGVSIDDWILTEPANVSIAGTQPQTTQEAELQAYEDEFVNEPESVMEQGEGADTGTQINEAAAAAAEDN